VQEVKVKKEVEKAKEEEEEVEVGQEEAEEDWKLWVTDSRSTIRGMLPESMQ
jgi:hypothetical protein